MSPSFHTRQLRRRDGVTVAIIGLLVVLAALLTLTLAPYKGNISALFHLDRAFAALHPVPTGFAVLDVPGYDGMQYYAIARNFPSLFVPSDWPALASAPQPGVYAYQRILLPTLAWLLALGRDGWLPAVFLAINAASLLGAGFLILRWQKGTPLLAFALALCPAATIGLHFSLAEPLSIVLTTLFLLQYVKKGRMDALNALLLIPIVLTREVNFFFALGLVAVSLLRRALQTKTSPSPTGGGVRGEGVYNKQIKDALLCIPGLLAFALWQGFLLRIFGDIPLLTSTAKSTFPLVEPVKLVLGMRGYDAYTLSAIALFLLFVLPATVLVGMDMIRTRRVEPIPALLLLFLLLMLSTSNIIWGSITSIGRTITPVYPLFVLYAGLRGTRSLRIIAIALLFLGIGTGLGLGLIPHPFSLT